MAIDRKKMIRFMDARIAETADAMHAEHLKVVREHMDKETDEDIDGLLATISPKRQQYQTWGAPDRGIDMAPSSFEGIAEYYRVAKQFGQLYFQYDIDRLTVADYVVITDGLMTSLVPGITAVNFGITDEDPGSVYEAQTRLIITWPLDDTGLLVGEESYSAPIAIRKLAPEEVPADYAGILV